MFLGDERNSFAAAASMSPLVNHELEHDRRFHPNLGGVTRGGLANHYPMTIVALQGLGASDHEVGAFSRSWPRHRASLVDDLALVDQWVLTAENWPAFLGQSDRLLDFRRVFEALLAGPQGLATVPRAVAVMRDGLPMGLFHPLIRLSFAVVHGDRGLIADALAYMAIRHFDLYRTPELPRREHTQALRTATGVWRQLGRSDEVSRLLEPLGGASIHTCELLCANGVVQSAALPPDFDLSGASLPARMPEISALALRLYLFAPSLTTLHAVTAAQALADLTLRAAPDHQDVWAGLWARYWVWLTALCLEKGRPGDLPVLASDVLPAEDWPELAARARAVPEVHLIKMTYSCRWLDETFGPEPLYKVAVVNMLRERRAHPQHGVGLASAAI